MNENWTFFTNHAHVLLYLSKSADMRIRDIAIEVNITKRTVQKILFELTEGGYLEKVKNDNDYSSHLWEKDKIEDFLYNETIYN